MVDLKEVRKWLQADYKIDGDDSEYVAKLVIANNKDDLIESFVEDESNKSEWEQVTNQVDGLIKVYNTKFKANRPIPKRKAIEYIEAEPSPKVEIPEEDTTVDYKSRKEILSDIAKDVVENGSKVDNPDPDFVPTTWDGNNPPEALLPTTKLDKAKRKVSKKRSEIQTTDISVPPEYPLSHGMQVNQIYLLINLIKSIKTNAKGKVVFDKFKLDSGGIDLDEARPGFATLFMREGICKVVTALKEKPSGVKYWAKKVIPILPMAQQVIDDFKKRKPDDWKLINDKVLH